ncbi:hypothetical protein BBP40_003832 [Aspergillus hancockii]|nr:hypothetical protein BBP40_003832 [Aspergillus hancockii]
MESEQRHATVDRGHITKPERLENTYTTDTSLQRALSWYLPPEKLQQAQSQLVQLGEEAVSDEVRGWSADAERHQPHVKGFNVWGQRYDYDRLITSEGWKRLGKWGARHGTSDGAALILGQERRNLPADHPFHAVYEKLLSTGEDYWTSGQWMTERAGGSDVQNTETWATYSPLTYKPQASNGLDEGDYLISGFKFFSSATDANMALLLAKTTSGKLSTFLAPLRKTVVGEDGKPHVVTNGVRIHRLKNKLGTKELPTAELELKDMRAHLVGAVDHGVTAIAPLLNITRTHTFVGSLAAWRRAISIAKSFAKARTTVGEPLWLIPMHLRLLADMEVKHRGAMNLAFFTIAVMGVVENNGVSTPAAHLPSTGKESQVVFRALTAIAKAVISKDSIAGIQECQEAMGGVGYMDEPDEPELNIARLLRNTAVNSIWEGTTNVLASELVRFLVKWDNLAVFAVWFDRALGLIRTTELATALQQTWTSFLARIKATTEPRLILGDGRRVMFTLAWLLCGVLLALDAERDGDGVVTEIARRWILTGEGGVGIMVWRDIIGDRRFPTGPSSVTDEHLRWDSRIAWGVELPAKQVSGHRSFQGNDSKL